jgi:hypothetical protein
VSGRNRTREGPNEVANTLANAAAAQTETRREDLVNAEGGRQVDAELRGHAEDGWKLQIFHDGGFTYATVDVRVEARAEADEQSAGT